MTLIPDTKRLLPQNFSLADGLFSTRISGGDAVKYFMAARGCFCTSQLARHTVRAGLMRGSFKVAIGMQSDNTASATIITQHPAQSGLNPMGHFVWGESGKWQRRDNHAKKRRPSRPKCRPDPLLLFMGGRCENSRFSLGDIELRSAIHQPDSDKKFNHRPYC
jgi:hypothetical protein